MTTWNVTVRNRNGGLETVAVQAPDRAAVFAEMRAKGVSVVRIDEVVAGKPALGIDGKAIAKWAGRFAGFAVVVAVIAVALAWYFHIDVRDLRPGRISVTSSGGRRGAASVKPADAEERAKPKSAKAIAAELQEKARPFVKKASTNAVEWIVPPLDPDDPDNAMRTAVAQDVGSLLSIVPGEEVPPIIPFSFMFEGEDEDDASGDGGNKAFLESLRKWKLVIKETDSVKTAEAKQRLAEAHVELLDNIDKGLTVNDSIRAAYDFRVRAAATRNSFIEAIKGVYESDGDAALARKVMKDMNERLAAEGILEISEADILPDLEEEDGDAKDGGAIFCCPPANGEQQGGKR